MGRIVSMWEQAKKKRLTVEWFYRGEDVERACLEHSKPKEEESVGVTLEPPSKVLLRLPSSYESRNENWKIRLKQPQQLSQKR